MQPVRMRLVFAGTERCDAGISCPCEDSRNDDSIRCARRRLREMDALEYYENLKAQPPSCFALSDHTPHFRIPRSTLA
eukprot:908073-Rhodomonas_salina.1